MDMSIPKPVVAMCQELFYLSQELGRCACGLSPALKKLIDIAKSEFQKDVLRGMEFISTGRVDLAELQLDFEKKLGPKPSWTDAVAYVAAKIYTRCGDIDLLALALCTWAYEKWEENPHHPIWRLVESLEPQQQYRLDQLPDIKQDRVLLRKIWSRAKKAEAAGDKIYGYQLIRAAFTILAGV